LDHNGCVRPLLLELIDDYGIEVHTLIDKRIYGQGTDMADLVVSLAIMFRANEESERKKKRVGAIWKRKKESTAEHPGVAITAKVPLWIKAKTGEPMTLISERANVVRPVRANLAFWKTESPPCPFEAKNFMPLVFHPDCLSRKTD
jgi:hypothetical protein